MGRSLRRTLVRRVILFIGLLCGIVPGACHTPQHRLELRQSFVPRFFSFATFALLGYTKHRAVVVFSSGPLFCCVKCKYYLYRSPVNMCKSFDGVTGIVQNRLKADPLSAAIFIFLNRHRNQVRRAARRYYRSRSITIAIQRDIASPYP